MATTHAPFRAFTIASAEGRSHLDQLRREGCVLWIGSAISLFPPSDLPPGQALTNSIAKLLAKGCRDEEAVCRRASAVAFEHLMEACPEKDIAGDILTDLYKAAPFNRLHEGVAHLMKAGVVEHIVTTNYDPCLESAASRTASPTPWFDCVAAEADVPTRRSNKPMIFKIHGCARRDAMRRGGGRSLVFHLRAEGELPEWKRRLLYRIAAGRNVLVLGYSGFDFELCPEIPALRSTVTWCSRRDPMGDPDALSVNARRVLSGSGGTVLIGDMGKLLSQLAGTTVTTHSAKRAAVTLGDLLEARLSPQQVDEWRVTTMTGIGFADETIVLASRMAQRPGASKEERAQALIALARGYFHKGKYRHASDSYREASLLASELGDLERRLGAELDLAEAQRCAGLIRRARRTLRAVEATLPAGAGWLRTMTMLRQCLVLRHDLQVAEMLRWHGRATGIREQMQMLLANVAGDCAARGAWLELQQCELWAARARIPFRLIYTGPMNPLPSRQGYRQLGYALAESMATRDAMAGGESVDDKELHDRIADIAQLGASAELWKLSWVARRRKGRGFLTPGEHRQAVRSWRTCEYTFWLRVFLLLRP